MTCGERIKRERELRHLSQENLAEQMEVCVKNAEGTDYAAVFEHYRRLAAVLALKSDMGNQIREAYMAGNKDELSRFAKSVIPETICRVQALRTHHRLCWRQCGKALGWEIYDLHYGGTLARLDSAAMLIGAYLDGEIEELDEVRLSKGISGFMAYRRIATPTQLI